MDESIHHKFLLLAVKAGEEGVKKNAGGPFGAIVVRGDEVIAQGYNEVTSTNDPTAHAEMNAIRKAANQLNNFNLSDCVLYTSCEPCPMCLGAVYWSGITKVYYSATAAHAAEAGFKDLNMYREFAIEAKDRSVKLFQIPLPEALSLFEVWNDKKDKTVY